MAAAVPGVSSSHHECTQLGAVPDGDCPNDVEDVLKTWDRRVTIRKHTAVKSELSRSEFLRLPDGNIVPPYWAQERLRNDAATLQFVASNTAIPVPECRLFVQDGLLHLETTRITEGILLLEVEPESRAAAVQAVEEHINSDILPQLRSLRRKQAGSVNLTLPVFPPQRVYGLDRRDWPRITSESEDFVLCHNDLAPQNIFVDPDTFTIVGIIDWEYAGFYPEHFELPLWRGIERGGRAKMCSEAKPRELAFFGLKPRDIRDCRIAGS